jgi:hypothetical protein
MAEDRQPQGIRSVEDSFARMQEVLVESGPQFARVGGDVAFYVRGAKPPWWHATSLGGHVVIRPGNAAFPVFTVGIIPEALSWFVDGTLDVEKAFRKKRLAVEGDLEALGRFVACFSTP